MTYFVLRSFVRKLDRVTPAEQTLIAETIEQIKTYFETQSAPYGLRIKNLSPKIYEARINIHLRIIFFRDRDIVKFFCLGNHDDVANCLKNFKKAAV